MDNGEDINDSDFLEAFEKFMTRVTTLPPPAQKYVGRHPVTEEQWEKIMCFITLGESLSQSSVEQSEPPYSKSNDQDESQDYLCSSDELSIEEKSSCNQSIPESTGESLTANDQRHTTTTINPAGPLDSSTPVLSESQIHKCDDPIFCDTATIMKQPIPNKSSCPSAGRVESQNGSGLKFGLSTLSTNAGKILFNRAHSREAGGRSLDSNALLRQPGPSETDCMFRRRQQTESNVVSRAQPVCSIGRYSFNVLNEVSRNCQSFLNCVNRLKELCNTHGNVDGSEVLVRLDITSGEVDSKVDSEVDSEVHGEVNSEVERGSLDEDENRRSQTKHL